MVEGNGFQQNCEKAQKILLNFRAYFQNDLQAETELEVRPLKAISGCRNFMNLLFVICETVQNTVSRGSREPAAALVLEFAACSRLLVFESAKMILRIKNQLAVEREGRSVDRAEYQEMVDRRRVFQKAEQERFHEEQENRLPDQYLDQLNALLAQKEAVELTSSEACRELEEFEKTLNDLS